MRCGAGAGKVWPAAEGGGPAGALPPHDYKIWFTHGGVGTLLPLCTPPPSPTLPPFLPA